MTTSGSLRYTMTQDAIDRWAELSGDRNPLHISQEYASRTQFGSTIAHGHLGLAYMQRLMMDIAGERWLRGGRLEGVRFRAPVRPGHDYVVVAEPTEPGGGEHDRLTVQIRTVADGSVCVTGEARVPPASAQ